MARAKFEVGDLVLVHGDRPGIVVEVVRHVRGPIDYVVMFETPNPEYPTLTQRFYGELVRPHP